MWPLPPFGFLDAPGETARLWNESVTGAEFQSKTDVDIVATETVTQAESGALAESWSKTLGA